MAGTAEDRNASRSSLWATYSLLGVLLLIFLGSRVLHPDGRYSPSLDGGLVCGVELVASALCIARGLQRRPGRTAALVLGCSTASLEEPFVLDVVKAQISAGIGIAIAPTDAPIAPGSCGARM